MATLTFPTIIPSSVSFGIRYSTQVNISPLSGAVQTVEVPGARWVANLTFDDMEAPEGRELAAFIAQMRGSAGRFYLFDHSHRNPRGTNLAAGNVVVNTGAGTLTTTNIPTSGWDINETGLLLPGDYVEINVGELKMVTASVDSNASGQAQITVEPPIRNLPANTSIIKRADCEALMLLNSDEYNWVTDNPGLLTNINFTCIEGF